MKKFLTFLAFIFFGGAVAFFFMSYFTAYGEFGFGSLKEILGETKILGEKAGLSGFELSKEALDVWSKGYKATDAKDLAFAMLYSSEKTFTKIFTTASALTLLTAVITALVLFARLFNVFSTSKFPVFMSVLTLICSIVMIGSWIILCVKVNEKFDFDVIMDSTRCYLPMLLVLLGSLFTFGIRKKSI